MTLFRVPARKVGLKKTSCCFVRFEDCEIWAVMEDDAVVLDLSRRTTPCLLNSNTNFVSLNVANMVRYGKNQYWDTGLQLTFNKKDQSKQASSRTWLWCLLRRQTPALCIKCSFWMCFVHCRSAVWKSILNEFSYQRWLEKSSQWFG